VSESGGSDVSAFSAGAVARRLGVAVTTLRTWHQRYGLGPSLHEPGQHRRYTEQDIERLERMQRLITAGVSPAQAARWVTHGLDRAGSATPPSESASLETSPDSANFLGSSPAALRWSSAPATDPFGSSTGAAAVPITPVSVPATVRGVQRAALRLDAPAVRQLAAHVVRRVGVIAAWDEVLRPVLTWIGERHAATGALVEVEHLLSTSFSAVLGAVPRPSPTVPLRIMLACADEEQHSLPIEAIAAALASAGIPARMLGARLPTAALLAAVRRTGPSALLVWSHSRSTGDPAQLAAVVAEQRRPLVIAAAGPGWDRAKVPAEVSCPASLTEAISQLTAYPLDP
jgi:MerR family transcriptional regulator, light-induced transcriptional regulator